MAVNPQSNTKNNLEQSSVATNAKPEVVAANERPRVLFVDDEPDVLNSLRRMFRKHRKKWDLNFANSGPEAIEEIQKEHFHVIFTDMRMPGLDGAAVLRFAAKESPGSVRYVLSGHADQDSIDNAAHLIHQYLHKPASMDELEHAIEAGIENGCGESTTQRIRTFVNGLSSLPSQPRVYTELVDCSQSELCSMHEVTAIVQSDPAVSAKVLQLVNSSFYALATKVCSIPLAIRYLGIENLKRLALAASVFRTANFKCSKSNQYVEKLWTHSIDCAEKAADFASTLKMSNSSEAFTAGLLHDVGKLLLLESQEDDYMAIATDPNLSTQDRLAAEQKTFGFNHAQLGAHMLQLWGLPDEIVEGVRNHHEDLQIEGESYSVSLVVNAANEYLAMQEGRVTCLSPLLLDIQTQIMVDR